MNKKRLLPIKSGHNFRELGGYQTMNGRTIKWDRLIRSGSLSQLNTHDQQVLAQIPVTIDIDFRSEPEIMAAPDQVPTTADYHHLPVFATDVTNASRSDREIAQAMQQTGNGFRHMLLEYRRMAKIPSAKQAYQTMFQLLLTNESGAALFHCTAGKDRTGFGAFLILTALGVPHETIMNDYLMTNSATADFRRAWLENARTHAEGFGNVDAVIANRRDLISVHREYLEAAIQTVDQLAGDPRHYLTDYLGLSSSDLKTLRHLYLN